jgi:TatD DNase family protein
MMIDTHCHIYFADYDVDRAAVLERSRQAGVEKLLMPYVESATYEAMMATAAQHAQCYPMIGLHPTAVQRNWRQEYDFAQGKLEALPASFVAIGEIGIDAYWSKDYMQEQKAAFAMMLCLANEYDLPVVIHCRDAFAEVFEVLDHHKKSLRGVFHAFSGDLAAYHKIKEYGDFKVGIGGVVTFKNAQVAQVIKDIPMTDILLETDAPYLTPVPHRGKRNESSYLVHVVERIAAIKQLTSAHVQQITTSNAQGIFK